MTFAQLLAYAIMEHGPDGDIASDELADNLAGGIRDLLGESQPCGIEPPPVVSMGDGTCGVLVDDRGDALTVDEARAFAAMVLRQADEAEERGR